MEADGDAGRPHDGADHVVDAAAKAAADAGDGWFSFSLSTFLLGLMGAAGATILGGLVLLFYFQRMLIYPRHVPPGSRVSVAKPSEFGMHHYEDLMLKTKDGVKVHAYLITRPDRRETKAAPTLLFLHWEVVLANCGAQANAGNMGHRLPIASVFYRYFDCNIMMLSYRGYGVSDGEPTEDGLRLDAQAALDYLLQHDDIDSTQIVAYGASLGGAVAIDLVARNPEPFRALIVENTFTALVPDADQPEVAGHLLPALRFLMFMCTEKWNSLAAISKVTVPTLVIVGTADTLVPPSMSERLFEASGAPEDMKKIVRIEGGTHNDTILARDYFEQVARFWTEYIKPLVRASTDAWPELY